MGKPAEHFTQARNMAAGQLLTNGITDNRILQAMVDVPRQAFLPPELHNTAYIDEDLPLGDGRMLMEPLAVARLINLAGITESSRVLVVGALNGYVPAVAAKLAEHVVAIETDESWLKKAEKNLSSLDITNIEYQKVKSLAEGYVLAAPYDAIIVAGAVEYISEQLGEQLSISGKLTTIRAIMQRPGSKESTGKCMVVTRVGGTLQYREHSDVATATLPDFMLPSSFAL